MSTGDFSSKGENERHSNTELNKRMRPQDAIRALGGIELFVNLVSAQSVVDCTQTALLALRILTESETDRVKIAQV